jgi:hypothetical protein
MILHFWQQLRYIPLLFSVKLSEVQIGFLSKSDGYKSDSFFSLGHLKLEFLPSIVTFQG